jgi:hypothetical protein
VSVTLPVGRTVQTGFHQLAPVSVKTVDVTL